MFLYVNSISADSTACQIIICLSCYQSKGTITRYRLHGCLALEIYQSEPLLTFLFAPIKETNSLDLLIKLTLLISRKLAMGSFANSTGSRRYINSV